MLTLFKPWRHGKNLKEDDQSWDEAFANYKFTPCQTELMKFFNICYEWNDARDDYSKLLNQQNATRMVSFLTGSALMTMITLVITMMVVTSEFMKSMKQINTLLLERRVNKG
jgi:hypothetical protein